VTEPFQAADLGDPGMSGASRSVAVGNRVKHRTIAQSPAISDWIAVHSQRTFTVGGAATPTRAVSE
jgi:hypothetical protein